LLAVHAVEWIEAVPDELARAVLRDQFVARFVEAIQLKLLRPLLR